MRDLDFYRNLRRPAADVNVGDDVRVQDFTRNRFDWGRVTKVARVWITVKTPAYGEQQFRRDNGNSKVGECRFATCAQVEFDGDVVAATKLLNDRRVETFTAHLPDAHLIALADLLHALDQPAKEA